ncbi:MAG: bifunctional [glutamine synthetase] adenylyltransferase/[glutamine synthetase]-adenylyl-L-tyrosine phosphorylase [Hyphomicrobium sp.]
MTAREGHERALWRRIVEVPVAVSDARVEALFTDLTTAAAADPALVELNALITEGPAADLVKGVLSGSQYLTTLMLRDPARLQRILTKVPEDYAVELGLRLRADLDEANDQAAAMRLLRVYKTELALLIGLADLGGVWPVLRVTEALTETADTALQGAVRFLFRQAVARGRWLPDPAQGEASPESGSGYFVLGMGKYGAHELNYSSDIDLIVFYEAERARVAPGVETQTFFVAMTRDLVRLMDERTPDGYVFRTDLRLRPDSGATQVALSTDAGLVYYESFGQNWERAALIKARAVAGDLVAGDAFLAELSPFIWRKYLDFAAIADIHAMKRQIHAFRGFAGIAVPGHNIKLGPGGIREIEFFAQTQQLIAGGRQRDLRQRRTLDALRVLAQRGWLKEDVRTSLEAAYLFLRRLEHRLQMVADEQTHELPEDGERLESLARFSGFPDLASFSAAVTATLAAVQRHYAVLFESAPELTSEGANMVFAGEEDDPATVAALARLGYAQPAEVIATVRGWHHGRYPAVRTPRARERLTEVQPMLIAELAKTADPAAAFASFDRFLAELPSGVQLFSLLKANPGLLRLVADIMGTAPRLARVLSRRRRLLDAVLDPRTLGAMPMADDLDRLVSGDFGEAADMQEVLDRARIVGSEQAFLIGVRVLSGAINAGQAGGAYALLAERLIAALQAAVEAEMLRAHGRVPEGAAAVIAMGKLGGREMTASSDLDLMVVYDFDPYAVLSDGARGLAPQTYFTRVTQRLIAALSSPTAEGTLYEVDMRLRPSGQKGPVATQLSSFIDYQAREAWTWEYLALTRARVVTGPDALRQRIEGAIRTALTRAVDREKITADVRDMRRRIFEEKGTADIWDLKQVRGGLVDLEFIAQYLQLVHARSRPEILEQNTLAAFQKLAAVGFLPAADAELLVAAARLIHDLTLVLRLCLEGPFDPAAAPPGLRELLCRAGDAPSFASLEMRLRETLSSVHEAFDRIVV